MTAVVVSRLCTWYGVDSSVDGQFLGLDFVAHASNGCRIGADEGNLVLLLQRMTG